MVAISSYKVCYLWARVLGLGLNSPWFGTHANADPETFSGGVPFGAGAVLTSPLFLTAAGTGDGGVIVNTGFDTFFGAVPSGYFPGWPNASGTPDAMNPASSQGSAVVGALNEVSFPTVAGYAQSETGWNQGKFYFEYAFYGDLFTNLTGCGAMRGAPSLSFVFGGEYAGGDPNGGVMVGGGFNNSWNMSAGALGVLFPMTPLNMAPNGESRVGIAVAMVNQTNFVPQPFMPVRLPNLNCCRIIGQSF